MSKTIKISDEIGKNLARIAAEDGNTMAAEIGVLISEHNMTKQICDRLSDIEKAINSIQSNSSILDSSTSLYASIQPQPQSRPEDAYDEDDYVPDRTYSEVLEEIKQLREELETLDDGDPRKKEIENKLRADNAELSLLDEDD
jgi:hypothetical protein